MNKVQARNFLVLVHLWLAGLLAPAFLLMAITGGLDLAGVEAEATEIQIELPTNVAIDPNSSDIDQDIGNLLSGEGIEINYESLRVRPDRITTRPTSRKFVRFVKEDESWTASLIEPSLQYSMMELHKGHGPEWFKFYEILVGISLLLVVIGGLAVGLIAKAYRTKTLLASTFGTIVFLLLGFAV